MEDIKLTFGDETQVRFALKKVLERKEITYIDVLVMSNVLGKMAIERLGLEKEVSGTVKSCENCKT